MEPSSANSLKDIVNLIDERLPGGRTISATVLALVVCAIALASVLYIKDHAIIPITAWVIQLFSSRSNISFKWLDVVINAALWIVIFLVFRSLGQTISRIIRLLEVSLPSVVASEEKIVTLEDRVKKIEESLLGRD